MRAIDGAYCPNCGGPLTYEAMKYVEDGQEAVGLIPSPAELALCVRCVALVLCKATVAIHGDVGSRPQSHNFPGHEDRMRAHEERVQGMSMANGVGDEDEYPAAVSV